MFQTHVVNPVQYGPLPRQVGALVFAKGYPIPNRNAPGVVFLHGGGWSEGSYLDVLPQAQAFVAMTGFLAFSADYRLLTPEDYGILDEILGDVQAAHSYLRLQECVDAEKMFSIGFSAGGANAVWHAIYMDANATPITVGSPLDLEQWVDYVPNRPEVLEGFTRLFGDPQGYVTHSPKNLANLNLLMLHGADDFIVPKIINEEYAARLTSSGYHASLLELPGDHAIQGQEEIMFSESLRFLV